MMRTLLLIGACCVFLSCAHLNPKQGPENHLESHGPGLFYFYDVWLDHLSFVRRGPCPMYPSCSQYARQAVEMFGPVRGWIMACDRLMRCGRDEVSLGRRIWVNGAWKIHDPVEENDLWTQNPEPKP